MRRPRIAGEKIVEKTVIVDGARLHLLRAGVGRPMVLIHGLVGSSRNWLRNLESLAHDASVYALDMINMGQSQRVAGLDSGFAATADRVAACMDALGLDEADIAGHSHGGAVAMMLAARHPKRVRSLILFAPANPFCELGHGLIRFYSTRLGLVAASIAVRLPTPLHRIALGRMYGDSARVADGVLEGYRDGLRIPGTVEHIHAIVRGWFGEMALLKQVLPRIASVPTLLIWGDRDRAVGLESAEKLQRVLRESELMVVPEGGHLVFEEFPEVCNAAMREWLHRDLVSGSRASAGRQMWTESAREQAGNLQPVRVAARAKLTDLGRLSPGV